MFLVLPSNASMDIYPQNKTSEFTVQLPKSIDLEGSWEVGLAEIQYQNSWYNIDDINDHWIYYRQKLVSGVAGIPAGFYQSPRHVVDQLLKDLKLDFNRELTKALNHPESLVTEPVKFRMDLQFNTYSQVATMEIDHRDNDPPNFRVTFSPALARVLGFSETVYEKPGVFRGSKIVNLNDVNAIYIYCDLVQPQIVGDILTPLLDVVAAKGKSGENISRRYDHIHYRPILKKNFSSINISLRDDQGNKIRFRKGKVIITLRLRRQELI